MKLHINIRIFIILSAVFGLLIFFLTKPIIVQPQDYHHFIDTRRFFGIPNGLDVLSNILFAVAGALGISVVSKKSWFWFFFSILLIAPGSAYYHLSPNDATLVWDRLPMSMGFMALYIVLLSEHISLKYEKFLFPAMGLGILSVVVWVVTTDLRFYFWVQFSSFITIPLILVLFRSRYTMKSYYFICLAFYFLAKWAEVKDKEVFLGTGEIVSGHTLKHCLAAMGLMSLWWMVRERSESEPSPSYEQVSVGAS